MQSLELELKKELENGLMEAKRLGAKVRFDIVYELIDKYGASKAAKNLISSKDIKSGFFKMYDIGRLDLTFEYIILDSKYISLFDGNTIRMAKERLKKFDIIR